MRKINPQVLVGLASLVAMLGAVAFLAHAAIVACTFGPCVGTNGNDKITVTGTGDTTVYALGGDDEVTNSSTGTDLHFLGNGNDKITLSGTGTHTVFAESGNDFIITLSGMGGGPHYLDGGLGNDTFTAQTSSAKFTIVDGRGRDVMNVDAEATINLVGDNEPDTVNALGGSQTIVLDRNSGRDFIDCGPGDDIVYLNGNNKAVGRKGGVLVNLRQVALLGGRTDTCETIIP